MSREKLPLASSLLPVSLPFRLFPSGQKFVIFYTEILHYSSVQNIQTVLISKKNIEHFTCDLLLFLEQTPISKYIANIFVQILTITRRGNLLCTVRMGRLSPVRACPSISSFGLYQQSSSDSRFTRKMEHVGDLFFATIH